MAVKVFKVSVVFSERLFYVIASRIIPRTEIVGTYQEYFFALPGSLL